MWRLANKAAGAGATRTVISISSEWNRGCGACYTKLRLRMLVRKSPTQGGYVTTKAKKMSFFGWYSSFFDNRQTNWTTWWCNWFGDCRKNELYPLEKLIFPFDVIINDNGFLLYLQICSSENPWHNHLEKASVPVESNHIAAIFRE